VPAKPTGGDGQTIRVDFSKLDALLNLVGELVLDKASLRSVLEGLDSTIRALDTQSRQIRRNLWGVRTPLSEGGTDAWNTKRPDQMVRALNEELGRVERVLRELMQEMDLSVGGLDFVSGQLRDQVMKLRMVPIASVFAKHRRNVRDLSRSLGKKVRLELEGQETELDKMLVEHLDEPLLHLVRNAVDHGIEPPDVRMEKDKPAEGWLKLKAEQRGNQFVVEVSDDGGGIEVEQLRRKAIAKGILTRQRASELTDRECLDLVFSPGFSTASSVTDLSGRGVGLDVVKEVISRLRGTVEVTSSTGKGTTFSLSLPLTLAIRQVLLLRVAGELTALPIDNLKRSLEIRPDQIHHLVDRDVLKLNDHHLPLIWLHRMLGLGPRPRWEGRNTLHVVQVKVLGHTYGLVCDGLEGKREIVIKSLGDLLTRVPCVAGATLVGDRVVLILDLPDLVRAWIRRELKQPAVTESDEPGPARRTVLLAEDSAPMREALREQCEQLGFQVLEATDGLEALELAKSGRFDLVSTDAMMPNLDGYELTRALRQDPRHRDVPIIMISVRGERIDKVRGFDAGVDGYLVKPTDITELNAMVRRLLAAQSDGQKPEPEGS
jgi:two-component system chemotaxis sensor kinase CheA